MFVEDLDRKQQAKARRLLRLLNEAADIADSFGEGLMATNGGFLGSIIGTLADELEHSLNKVKLEKEKQA